MTSSSKINVSDYLVNNCHDAIEVDKIPPDQCAIRETRTLSLNDTINTIQLQESNQFYYDSSTLTSTTVSDSVFEFSTDHEDYQRQLANFGKLINGSRDRLGGMPVSIEHSKDVNVGQMIINGNVEIRPRRSVHERYAAKDCRREEYGCKAGPTEIISVFCST